MAGNVVGNILVFSDNAGLLRAIELRLRSHSLEVMKRPLSPLRWPRPLQQPRNEVEVSRSDLIVVALSAPTSDPMVALARAALVTQISQAPILMISARSIPCEPGSRIIHMDFPFDLDEFSSKVKEILQSSAIAHADTFIAPVLENSVCL